MQKVNTITRSIYLQRLRRLVAIRNSAHYFDLTEVGQHMIELCIEATVLDCIEQGAAGQATRILAWGHIDGRNV